MTGLELIFTMLGKKVTTEISQKEKPSTFEKANESPDVEEVLLELHVRKQRKSWDVAWCQLSII